MPWPFTHRRLATCVVVLLAVGVFIKQGGAERDGHYGASQQGHTNNWAVLVDTSRFWFNYRHPANTLAVYRSVKRMGIPDSNIILMLADDMACNPRNVFPGRVFASDAHKIDLYGTDVEVDYRGYEVTVENFLRVLTGRHDGDTPRSKRLLSDTNSNIFIYMSGHGGDEFIKFQDSEELSALDISEALSHMYQQKRYNEIFFMVDTCQAATLHRRITSPNVLAVGGSLLGENAYSYRVDSEIGLSLSDRFTYYTLDFFERQSKEKSGTIAHLNSSYQFSQIQSHPGWRTDLFDRPLDQVPLTDFFGFATHVQLTHIPKDFLVDLD
ncbi:phosphatidylinositol glycan, class K [Pelomyxa schiedti]|nr:phosphatidylinositol glycan, class K [Pelomyxa schiedti]